MLAHRWKRWSADEKERRECWQRLNQVAARRLLNKARERGTSPAIAMSTLREIWDTEFRTGRRSTKLLFNDWTKTTVYPGTLSKNILRYWLEHGIDNDLARWQ